MEIIRHIYGIFVGRYFVTWPPVRHRIYSIKLDLRDIPYEKWRQLTLAHHFFWLKLKVLKSGTFHQR
jgi:hypothetical protein